MQNLQLADGGKRLLAFIIDALILSVVLGILFSILSTIGIFGAATALSGSDGEISDAEGLGMVAAMAGAGLGIQILSLALQIGYFTIMESSERQATIGKSAMGLIVADENGNRLDTQKALARNISRILSGMICLVGYFMAFFTEKKQALHDIIAKTNVYTKLS
ncbi:MAG: RDD family protein [Arcicella sp.]|jgi:uncharacterized RDD family membrane protein YckC|nr:RDD family protein [Arcicella sp.]